jgi:hypothetical protein
MSAWLDPVGPRSRSVYWRRRVVTLAVVLLGLFALTRACGSAQPPELGIRTGLAQTPVPLVSTYTPTPTPTPTPPPTALAAGAATADPTAEGASAQTTPTPATSPAAQSGPVGCATEALEVAVRSDARRYAAKVNPKLYITVVNRGETGCLFDVGSKALSLVVTSGTDRIWSSDDCQGAGQSDVRLLAPGKPFTAAAEWARVRSKPGCPKDQPAAKPGTYLLSGSANGVESQRRAAFLLD